MPAATGVTIRGHLSEEQAAVFGPDVQEFVAILHRAYNPRRLWLLKRREERQADIDAGKFPDFLPETEHVRSSLSWKGAKPAPGLTDRRVEITGPIDRKMVINALNAGSTQFMADFEDSTSPTWDNIMSGHVNMTDAISRTIKYSANGKKYELRPDGKIATLLIRPRGWHLEEKHFLVDGAPCSASIFDFAIYFYNNAKKAIALGHGPYFYLPKMESHLEARLWNDIFNTAQDYIGLPRGTIRATCLIETILGAYEMDEIIYELRDHSSGLNCGRWDYIFSVIKRFRNDPRFVLPDRADVGMTVPFMDAYVQLLIKTCHRRGVHAMGGMAGMVLVNIVVGAEGFLITLPIAQIPIKNDPKANEAAMAKVRADKLREVKAGHDGTWVAHPALVTIAMEIFNKHMPQPNQMHILREDAHITAFDLINTNIKGGKITEKGIKANVSVGLAYMAAWLGGQGCVPIHNLMEDAATAEISRSQLWQWVKHKAITEDGKPVTAERVAAAIEAEVALVKSQLGANYNKTKYDLAKKLFLEISKGEVYPDFITSLCYDSIVTLNASAKL